MFRKTVLVKTVQRQRGETQAGSRKALEELRTLKVSVESWKLLATRVQAKLSQEEVDSFRDALRVYSTKAKVGK